MDYYFDPRLSSSQDVASSCEDVHDKVLCRTKNRDKSMAMKWSGKDSVEPDLSINTAGKASDRIFMDGRPSRQSLFFGWSHGKEINFNNLLNL